MKSVEVFLDQIAATSLWEWLAVITGVIYVILAARKSIWCWSFAAISSAIYIYLCYSGKLYIESILQVFYLIMAIVGWVMWNRSKTRTEDLIRWKLNLHLLNVVLSGMVAISLGYMFDEYTNQANPYIDSFTTVYSLAATFMVTKKVVENWIYWIVIDIVSIYLYASRGFYLTSVLFFTFTVLAIVGYVTWLKKFNLQKA